MTTSASMASHASAVPADDITPPRVIDSRDLLAGGRELVIRHAQATYHLRLTGSNKLILTK